MKPDAPSQTAELMAFFRAIDAASPSPIVGDPYATRFLGEPRRLLLAAIGKLPSRLAHSAIRTVDRLILNVITHTLVRHRFMDDLFRKKAPDMDQVVVLGAGYDTRSFRLREAVGARPLYEVDHPATSARKQTLVSGFQEPGAPVRYVAVDFNRESLRDRLDAAGFQEDRKTFWFWEGVTMYLDEAAVMDTLRTLRGLCAPGSMVTFDHWHPQSGGILETVAHRDLPRLLVGTIYQEHFTFALPRDRVGPFLGDLAFRLDEDPSLNELDHRYVRRIAPLLGGEGWDTSIAVATAV